MARKPKPMTKTELVRCELQHLGEELVAEMAPAEIAAIILDKYKATVSRRVVQSVRTELFGLRAVDRTLRDRDDLEDEMV